MAHGVGSVPTGSPAEPEARTVPPASPYGEDLAYVQARAFGELASRAAPEIVRLLRARGVAGGTLVDVGCGAGVSTRCFADAGFRVVAIESSAALLDHAKAAAPAATFLPSGTLYDAPLPPCDAVVVLGEPLNYHPRGTDADGQVARFLRRVRSALRPGGVLLFDVIVRGAPPLDARGWATGDDWAILFGTRESPGDGWLEREIETFRLTGEGYRRSRERHSVRVFDEAWLGDVLASAGFAVAVADGYGPVPLAPRRRAFVATAPRD